jgi:hypothetical protein
LYGKRLSARNRAFEGGEGNRQKVAIIPLGATPHLTIKKVRPVRVYCAVPHSYPPPIVAPGLLMNGLASPSAFICFFAHHIFEPLPSPIGRMTVFLRIILYPSAYRISITLFFFFFFFSSQKIPISSFEHISRIKLEFESTLHTCAQIPNLSPTPRPSSPGHPGHSRGRGTGSAPFPLR